MTRMTSTKAALTELAPAQATPDYAVPALDKAIDILELLADQSGGMTQGEIADAVSRTPSQIFRVLQRLERRGWIARARPSGPYLLSTRMFDLAHRHPPLRGLIAVALGPMRELAESVRQSCNLSVLDAERVRVIAQVESPAEFGFRVRVGAEFSTDATPAGHLLTRGAPDGYLREADSLQPGIIDLVVPVVSNAGIIAAITVPYIATTYSNSDVDTVLTRLIAAGQAVSAQLQGGA